jgi:hypothetical protein
MEVVRASETSGFLRIKRRYNPEDRAHNALVIIDFYFNTLTYLLIEGLCSYCDSTEQANTLVTLLSFILEVPGSSLYRNINVSI